MEITKEQFFSLMKEWEAEKVKIKFYADYGSLERKAILDYNKRNEGKAVLLRDGVEKVSTLFLDQAEFIEYNSKNQEIVFHGQNKALNQAVIKYVE